MGLCVMETLTRACETTRLCNNPNVMLDSLLRVRSLKVLALRDNAISDEHVQRIALALMTNTTLTHLM
jgi:Ran GTPase-activating protein (RanGAP) involved in mRNA processing and transport